MVRQKGHIEAQGEPLCCAEEHDTEEGVDEVLWKHKLEGSTDCHRAQRQLLIRKATATACPFNIITVFLESKMLLSASSIFGILPKV